MELIERYAKKLILQIIGLFRSGRKISPRELPVNHLKRILIVRQQHRPLRQSSRLRALWCSFPWQVRV